MTRTFKVVATGDVFVDGFRPPRARQRVARKPEVARLGVAWKPEVARQDGITPAEFDRLLALKDVDVGLIRVEFAAWRRACSEDREVLRALKRLVAVVRPVFEVLP